MRNTSVSCILAQWVYPWLWGHRTLVICVCPPHTASEVAGKVLACSFKGVYADLNAISPHRVERIGQSMSDACVEFVDGGIIGGPAWKPDATRLYLSGRTAGRVAECFAGGPLAVEVIGAEI